VHVEGAPLSRAVAMPALPGAVHYQPANTDRMGEQSQAHPIMTIGGTILGSIAGASLLRAGHGGILRGIIGGLLGAAAGFGSVTWGMALADAERAHDTSASQSGRAADPRVQNGEHVRVMTWNVHGGMGGPNEFLASERELDLIAAAVRREHPDVLVLQEVDRYAARSNLTNTLQEMERRLDPTSAVGATAKTQIAGRDQEVAVMTFNGFEVENARDVIHPDPRGGSMPVRLAAWWRDTREFLGDRIGQDWASSEVDYQVRNTIDTMVRTPAGTSVRVLSGHYEGPNQQYDHQELQIRTLAQALDAWQGATIWGADFNVSSAGANGAKERAIMADAGLFDSFADVGYAPDDPRRFTSSEGTPIDRIYHSRQFSASGTHTVRADWASDHEAVVTDLVLHPDAVQRSSGRRTAVSQRRVPLA